MGPIVRLYEIQRGCTTLTENKTSHIPHHTPTAGANPRKIEGTPLDPAWIRLRTNEELVSLLYEISRELKSRLVHETEEVFWVAAPESFQTLTSDDAFDFIRLPTHSTKSADEAKQTTWRIVLIGSRPEHRPIAIEIFDDVTIGRKVEGPPPRILISPTTMQIGWASRASMPSCAPQKMAYCSTIWAALTARSVTPTGCDWVPLSLSKTTVSSHLGDCTSR